jgi:hypothetical protein
VVVDMAQYLPELAIGDDFASTALEPDEDGVYRVVEYRRMNGTLYMRSTLTTRLGKGQYQFVTLSYYDETGKIHLHNIKWELKYDINKKIVQKQVM